MFLYIHGFNSSPLSQKTQEFRRWLAERGRENEWICPDLPHQPAEAFALLCTLVEQAQIKPKLVGSSLGGFYATALSARYDLKAVVINPAVHAPLVLRSALGPQVGYYDDTQYEFTQQHLDELQALDLLAPANPDNILLMQEREDEVLDWKAAVDYYRDCHQLVFRGGDHSFTRFGDVIELIDRF